MAFSFQDMVEEARLSARALIDYGEHFFNPTVRLGVTGLSRAGKTVFITALIHGLTRGGRFPVFEAYASGRIARAHLAPQPDDAVPRFAYENHLRALIEERRWPNSTVDISELRARHRLSAPERRRPHTDARHRRLSRRMAARPAAAAARAMSNGRPKASRCRARRRARIWRADWHAHLATLEPEAREDEQATLTAARLFTDYLRACRDERFAMSLLPPGRFLMPGNLAGSPALTFAPLDVPAGGQAPEGSLWAMMERRYEAYKDVVVRPFFRDHFARLDRQIVLVDALAAFNAGPEALHDLEAALAGILDCFRIGRSTFLSGLFRPRIDRILFAATKADHLHHASHDRLEAVLRRAVARARRARGRSPAPQIDVVALAAVRATREAQVAQGRDKLPSILGTPARRRKRRRRDLRRQHRGRDLSRATCRRIPRRCSTAPTHSAASRPRPPRRAISASCASVRQSSNARATDEPALPHIRLDRALQFLIGDRLHERPIQAAAAGDVPARRSRRRRHRSRRDQPARPRHHPDHAGARSGDAAGADRDRAPGATRLSLGHAVLVRRSPG